MKSPFAGAGALAAALARIFTLRYLLIDLPVALARRALERWL